MRVEDGVDDEGAGIEEEGAGVGRREREQSRAMNGAGREVEVEGQCHMFRQRLRGFRKRVRI